MGIPGLLQHCGLLLGTTDLCTRVTMVTLAVVILVDAFLLTLTMAPHCFFLQLAQANQHQAPTTIFPNFLLNFLSHRPLLLQ